jgi:hypothetical protein
MAPQEMRSAMNWGEMVSRSSEPTGIPMEVMSTMSSRARRRPLLILKELSISGSLVKRERDAAAKVEVQLRFGLSCQHVLLT